MKKLSLFLFAATLAFAESHRPNCKLPDCYPGIYNVPANVDLACGWDVSATGSFIYWRASQDFMDSAFSAEFGLLGPSPAGKAANLYPSFGYHPGFKVGIGAESVFDHWNLTLDYTWLHQKTTNSTGSLPAAVAVGDRVWIPKDWFNSLDVRLPSQQAAQVENKWKMHLDMLDLTASLPFYEAPEIVIYHMGGVRGLWVRQNYNVEAVLANALGSAPVLSQNSSKCWSVGPLVGIAGYSLFKWGFRVQGETKFSMLYTRYTTLTHEENDQGFGDIAAIAGSMATYGCIRPTSELGLGIGWGSYFGKTRYHADFSATYDFTILWSQNMMRQTVGSLADTYGYANMAGNLYLHGLTVDARLNF